ncbi:DEAD/DEAH box helicase [Vagococcus acidifermentans]|jgi:hypothetical protein|uniref:Helicase n=1 Tax=Vagococcus acidifermentans TaxID=564710 RepID=A0A430AZ23_9ENTE|nr:DEAD/DEAH box helicase [Vagococcus acidifermentans]RSU13313.1 helicase [Vagococcus acidifermentans]
MGGYDNVVFGELLYKDIDDNEYLNELYENILYNYSLKLFKINRESRELDISAALRFADILSKSVHKEKSDKHKIWAQEIVALLHMIYPQDYRIKHYMGSVLQSTGNYRGMDMITPDFQPTTLLEKLYTGFNKDYLSIPAEPEQHFFRSQKIVYDRLEDSYFSYSGPTSMGKSFIMRMFLKKQVMDGIRSNFALIVPTKALINEVSSKIINDLKELLKEHNYRLITSAGALSLKEEHNFIFVLTPERLLYLLIDNPAINIEYLFIDEAHKISTKGSRSAFYYKVVDMLCRKKEKPHVIFASPNIPNPEIYLKLIPEAYNINEQKLTTSFAPVSQMKYLIDLPNKKIEIFNDSNKNFIEVAKLNREATVCELITRLGGDGQNIIYCPGINKAITYALDFAKNKGKKDNQELITLAKDIKNEVHRDYYLADLIPKGVAYHIGYLPSTIKMRIEELYREGLIETLFCTSTLMEGVNLPADNLFVTDYKIGRGRMSAIDFKNLIGRVGRIEYNLYGNVFLMRPEEKIKSEIFVELLKEDIQEQKLSVVTELSNNQKVKIVESLVKGDVQLTQYPKNQTVEEYSLMRKFTGILLRDIMQSNKSLVWKEFSHLLNKEIEEDIRNVFNKRENRPDDDINVSVDQSSNLTTAIMKGLKYPTINENNNVVYGELLDFLEELCKIFKWEIYEKSTLGFRSKDGRHGKLRWYAVILSQWIKGTGLSYIMEKGLEYKRNRPKTGVRVNGKILDYNDSKEHRNIAISEALDAIENVILFSISNYFLRFSTEYKRIHEVESFNNDWYEYVEYGTTNPLSIMLQRNGFSRETSTYIRRNRDEYVVKTNAGDIKLRSSLADCGNVSVQKEVEDIKYNIPELFVH